ncbi:MAG: ABC transporter substrate-binding protein [Ilumatobacteraceae bacterium]|nr:MAG: ABC transporter substrate-binding protein [Actinomycetota bacterium]
MNRVRRSALALFAAALLGACGGDDASSTDTSAPVEPTSSPSTDPADSAPSEPAADAPSRIVSLSPTHTEMLFAIGAGEQVIAVDSLSNYPPEAAAVLTELSAFEPNVEAIAAYEPDLVVISDDFTGITEQLAAVDIDVWSGPAPFDLDDVYAQIQELGTVTAHSAGADELVGEMRAEVEAILAGAPELEEPLTYYHELDDTYFSVSANTFVGQIYGLLGLRNITDLTEVDTDYPQLSAEFVVSADPDLIFLACTVGCGTTAESVAARPGWSAVTAVREGGIVALDDDVASRWGPRVVELLRVAADAVAAHAT